MIKREKKGSGWGTEAQLRNTLQSFQPAKEHRPLAGFYTVPTESTLLSSPDSYKRQELRGSSFIWIQPPTNPLQLCTFCQALAREPAIRIYCISEPLVPPQAFHTPGGGQERRGITETLHWCNSTAVLQAGIQPSPDMAWHFREEPKHQSGNKFKRKGKITICMAQKESKSYVG